MQYAPNTIPFTQAGYQVIVDERDALVARRPHAVAELSRARDEGDRSENAAYKAARWELSGLDKRLRYLGKLIDNVKICKPTDTNTVQIGSFVTVQVKNQTHTFQIVGIHEADPRQKKLSYKSPVGSALMHKQVSQQAIAQTPSGQIEYTIISIDIEPHL